MPPLAWIVVSYQRSVDAEMIQASQRTADRNRLNLLFFYIFLITGGLFLFLNVRTNFRNYRIARVALDAEQKRLDETIAELKRTQSTVVELQDLNLAKNAFISTVNHELRTPLTSIIGYLDVIKDEKLAESIPDLTMYLDVLDRNAQILLHLVESMLSLSQPSPLSFTNVFFPSYIGNPFRYSHTLSFSFNSPANFRLII